MFRQLLALILISSSLCAQNQTLSVLFLGNSYTGVNNLPQMTADLALSVGDSLIFDSNTPGGHTLQGHSSNSISLAKIALGNWDFVVLQEQSQRPAFPDAQVQTDVYPYARLLDSIINANNNCAETVFYMTWGRKNGDASNCPNFPPICTYMGMDSLLSLRYETMANDNAAIVSPVGAVWRYIRQNHPTIELYQTDESHPSVAGTYAAACAFYTVLFRKDPGLISFDAFLPASDALLLRNAVKTVVFDSLEKWNVGKYDPMAAFGFDIIGNEVSFSDSSMHTGSYYWDFGDGNSSTVRNPTHLYAMSGSYSVSLTVENCGQSDTITRVIEISPPSGILQQLSGISIYPNPVGEMLFVKTATDISGSDFCIYNSSGIVLHRGSLSSTPLDINISNFVPGLYYLKIGHNIYTFNKI